jgi:hypothetical protein
VSVVLGHPLLDDYLEFVAARSRTNTLLATAYDLKVFFGVVAKPPPEVTTADVLAFITDQRAPRRGGDGKVVRLVDGEKWLWARTIRRRLSSVSGLSSDLVMRADVGVAASPVPRGLTTRHATGTRMRGAALIRAPRTVPRILTPRRWTHCPPCSAPPRRARLPLRVDLRDLHVLLHQQRLRAHPATPTRPRRRTRPTRPRQPVHPPPRPHQRRRPPEPLTRSPT